MKHKPPPTLLELQDERYFLDWPPIKRYVFGMTSVSLAAAATQILSNSLNALKIVRERAQSSKDNDLKGHISTLYDNLLSLKEAVMLVTQENEALKRKVAMLEHPPAKLEPELRQVGAANFYFVGDKGPYCQPCYDGKGKLTALTPPEPWSGGIRRECVLCHEHFYEQPIDRSSVRIGRRRSPWS